MDTLPISSEDWARANAKAHRYPLQRVLDVFGALCGIVLLAPLFVAVAIAIRGESRGPALYRQTRVGRGGRAFTVLKFRSMAMGSDKAAPTAQSDRGGVCGKWRADPRVTRVGRFIRKTSIDELPQLFNVLVGDMSLVGPRPALAKEVAAYPQRAFHRLSVRPGLTGFWQVSGRADIDFDKMIDLDLAYVDQRSLLVDIALLCLTVRACLSGRGAY